MHFLKWQVSDSEAQNIYKSLAML